MDKLTEEEKVELLILRVNELDSKIDYSINRDTLSNRLVNLSNEVREIKGNFKVIVVCIAGYLLFHYYVKSKSAESSGEK